MTSTYRQRMAEKRAQLAAKPVQSAKQRVEMLEAELARLQAKYDDCNESRLFWRARCRELEAAEPTPAQITPVEYLEESQCESRAH